MYSKDSRQQHMIEESYVAASITVLYIRLLIALIGQNKKCYK